MSIALLLGAVAWFIALEFVRDYFGRKGQSTGCFMVVQAVGVVLFLIGSLIVSLRQ